METCSFVKACNNFFGRKPGQSLAEFSAELKELTEADRAELIALFPSVGYTIV